MRYHRPPQVWVREWNLWTDPLYFHRLYDLYDDPIVRLIYTFDTPPANSVP